MSALGHRLARITQQLGTGPHKVICLHDWFCGAESWAPIQPWLDSENFTYAFMDCRGYGQRIAERGEYQMAEIAHDVLALADALGWPEFSLVGHAMGGVAIQRVLTLAPERVHKLVGITPVPASGVPFDDATWDYFRSAVQGTDVRRAIIDLLTGNRLSGIWLDAMVRRSLATTAPEAMKGYLPSWAGADFLDNVSGFHHPVLVLVGVHDPEVSETLVRSTWMEAYPHAHIEILLNAGHYPMHEIPIMLATEIEGFLAD